MPGSQRSILRCNAVLRSTIVAAWLVGALALGRLANQYISVGARPSPVPSPRSIATGLRAGTLIKDADSLQAFPVVEETWQTSANNFFLGALGAAVVIGMLGAAQMRQWSPQVEAMSDGSRVVATQVFDEAQSTGRQLAFAAAGAARTTYFTLEKVQHQAIDVTKTRLDAASTQLAGPLQQARQALSTSSLNVEKLQHEVRDSIRRNLDAANGVVRQVPANAGPALRVLSEHSEMFRREVVVVAQSNPLARQGRLVVAQSQAAYQAFQCTAPQAARVVVQGLASVGAFTTVAAAVARVQVVVPATNRSRIVIKDQGQRWAAPQAQVYPSNAAAVPQRASAVAAVPQQRIVRSVASMPVQATLQREQLRQLLLFSQPSQGRM
mmetsp:Transcript_18066/g.46876  ORF Transcript_18066/g.46876 Transcript_18066/m.46876 type:complete len:381 (-) Transcript_18066:562-1704(-)|eukprot:CAMPEP_0183445506 /NCGR_PEP_ID=MMETSP0370-20130417/96357_1 /TAXON_ID=268820 /ORGANISM="Peridinium aciculiferum, Strain PAER-2" /LENGTH=380 /DNA_ID=CAMNT_0025636087 /DNA_START=59 /DNA_END=1201 /DNA_ORIENTATION=-